jgi:hypothetical protein
MAEELRMFSALFRSRCALWLSFLLMIGCQPVREDRSINFQRDGDQVGFQHGKDGVFIADVNGGAAKKIFQPADDVIATSPPLWSPTDKRLIFTTAKKADPAGKAIQLGGQDNPAGKLFLPSPIIYTCWLREEEKDGQAPEPVELFQAACDHPGYVAGNRAARWHPNGKHLLFIQQTSEHQHAVFEYDLQTKQARQVFKETAETILFDWAPDNTHLVCVLAGRGIWIGNPAIDDWWQVPESGVVQQVNVFVPGNLNASRPVWSREGKQFAFVSSRMQGPMNQIVHQLYLGTLETRQVEKLTEDAALIRDVRWSPNGERFGYVAGAEEGPLTFLRLADKSSSTFTKSVRGFIGWDEKNTSLAYVAADPIPHSEGAAWAFLLSPNPRARDAVWLAPADGSAPGKQVFSGMQVTFPQWSPKDARLSLWATFNPSYNTVSEMIELLTTFAQIDAANGRATPLIINGLHVRPGDPALLLNPETGALDWKAINPHEQFQLGHYYLLKRDYATAWQWYEKANRAAKPEDVRESLFFQHYCLTKLHRANEAKENLAQFEREFWPKLPEAPKVPNQNGLNADVFLRALADPKSPQRALLQELYVAEVFLSLDAAEDGETYFRDGLKNATTHAARLNKALPLSQFLLLRKKQREYLELAGSTLLPLLLSREAFPAEKNDNSLHQLSFDLWQKALLPLCDPEFAKSSSLEQTRMSLARLHELREGAGSDMQRAWLDILIRAAHQRLGQIEAADAVTKRLAVNPAQFDVSTRIKEARQSAAQMEELRQMMQFFQ